jgi:ABC-type lipoprotein export system ATPase subunit
MFSRGPEQRKTLLKHVTINVHPGEVAFVMGPSGAGE